MKKLIFIIPVIVIFGIILLVWFYYHNEKEPEVKNQLLSKNDMDIIESYRAKYQKFPGPSDEEIRNVAEILVSYKLTTEKIEHLLGKPSAISEIKGIEGKRTPLVCWAYDIGDSRRMSLIFDPNENLISIQGAGSDFDNPKPLSNK